MTAREVLAEVQRLGGRLMPKPPDMIAYELPVRPTPELLEAIRAAKPEILHLLAAPEPHPWHCRTCHPPTPHCGRWRGVTVTLIGQRKIALEAPAADLPAPHEWVQTPAGAADLLCWTADGAEGLVRLFRPRGGQFPLIWFPAERIIGELEWARKGRRA